MTWTRLNGGGEFYKFSERGDRLEGIWRGTRPGKFGMNGEIETDDGGVRRFSLTAGLRDLEDLPAGRAVRLTCEGMQPTKDGAREYRSFVIEVSDEADDDDAPVTDPMPPPPEAEDPGPTDADAKVPF